MINKTNIEFAREAVKMAKLSFEEGAFPAGAVLVKDNKIISKNISAHYPAINFHGESKCVDEAMNKLNVQLTDCVLYCSMEPCLMCLSRAYWAGIRKIFYVLKKEKVDQKLCYENDFDQEKVASSFNEKIEMIQIPELENEVLKIYNDWIEKNNH